MRDFSPEFQTPEQYIIDITYKIWEERGIGRIYDWYADEVQVRTTNCVKSSVESVVKHTLEKMHEFPDRELLAEDVIIGDKAEGFLSSHRVRSTATHLGDGTFGPATHRPVTMLAIADCLCRENQVVEEWLLRDQADVARQLGLDPVMFGSALGNDNPAAYTVGNEAMRQRWADPDGFVIVGDNGIANQIVDAYDAIWNEKNLHVMAQFYDRALRFEGTAGWRSFGRTRTGDYLTSMLASIPDGRFEPHHVIVRQQPERAIRVALRWSYCGVHSGRGRYGMPTGTPVALLGITHFELRDGLIAYECLVSDETTIYAQLAAYQQV